MHVLGHCWYQHIVSPIATCVANTQIDTRTCGKVINNLPRVHTHVRVLDWL